MTNIDVINHVLKQKIDKYKKTFEKTQINNDALTFLNKYPIKNITLPINSKLVEIPINIDNNNLPSNINIIVAIYWKLNNFSRINSINLIINTHQMGKKSWNYYNLIQPCQHLDKNFDDDTIGMYSFALHPMDSQLSGAGKMSKLLMEIEVDDNELNQLISNASIDFTIQYYYEQNEYLNFLIGKKIYHQMAKNFCNFMHCLKVCSLTSTSTKSNIFDKLNPDLIIIICNFLF